MRIDHFPVSRQDQPVIYAFLADVVVVIHFAFVVFVVVGGVLVLRWRGLIWIHIPAAVWGALIEFGGWVCPLTPLEQWLRRKAGEEAYRGGFVERYVFGALYPEGLTREMQIALGIVVIAINAVVYLFVFRRST